MTTWNAEIYGFGIFGTFTNNPGTNYLRGPDKNKLKQKRGRRKTRRIRNDMDESEVGRLQNICSSCNEMGHTYKKCCNKQGRDDFEAGPSRNPQDGRRPPARRARARGDGSAR